uniref:Uncharacterized protein n=1 Tax=Physcomitrium patens TaxID=3218 RepID=A0A2K1JBP4_PHYPA|nr:hypothetical protein PHYPA_019234 [Physcomitrium patens]
MKRLSSRQVCRIEEGLRKRGRSKYIFFCLPFFFYQKIDQKASNIRIVFFCTLQSI